MTTMAKKNNNNRAAEPRNQKPIFDFTEDKYYFKDMDDYQRRMAFLKAIRDFFEDEW